MNLYNYISKTFLIMSISMLCSFFITILLAKKMDYESFGLFSLVKTVLPLLSTIALLGFDKAYIRQYANKKVENISYYLFLFLFLFSLLISFFFTYLYGITQFYFIILIGTIFGAINLFLTSHFRLVNKYTLAQFILSGHKIIFFVFIGLYFYYDFPITDSLSIYMLCLSILIPSIFYYSYHNNVSKNSNLISYTNFLNLYKNGFPFFILNYLNQIILTIDKWTIPLIFGNQILGIYSALGLIYITTFNLFSSAIGYVIFAEFSKRNNLNLKENIIYIFPIALILFIGFIIFGDYMNSLIYNQKYKTWQNTQVNFYFTIFGLLHFSNAISHWIILSKGSKKLLSTYSKYMLFQIIIIISAIYLFSFMISSNIEHILILIITITSLKLLLNIYIFNKLSG